MIYILRSFIYNLVLNEILMTPGFQNNGPQHLFDRRPWDPRVNWSEWDRNGTFDQFRKNLSESADFRYEAHEATKNLMKWLDSESEFQTPFRDYLKFRVLEPGYCNIARMTAKTIVQQNKFCHPSLMHSSANSCCRSVWDSASGAEKPARVALFLTDLQKREADVALMNLDTSNLVNHP